MVGARPFRVEALGFEFSYRRSFAAAVCRDLFGFALNALGRKQRQFQQLGRGGVLVLKSLAVTGGMGALPGVRFICRKLGSTGRLGASNSASGCNTMSSTDLSFWSGRAAAVSAAAVYAAKEDSDVKARVSETSPCLCWSTWYEQCE